MKNKVLNILIPLFIFCDIALFELLCISVLGMETGHTYPSDNYKTVSSSNGKVVLDIYDESLYVHHEPDYCLYTADRNGKAYMSFSADNYDVEINDDHAVLEYEHNHNLRFYVF